MLPLDLPPLQLAADSPDLLAITNVILLACGQARQAPRKGLAAPLWDYTVPRSKDVMAMLRRFVASAGQLDIEVNGVAAGWVKLAEAAPVVASNGIEQRMEYQLLGGPVRSWLAFLPWPSRAVSDLCHRQWAEFGVARVGLPGSLLPEMSMDSETAVLTWDKPPQLQLGTKGFFGLWRKLSHTTIEAIRIGPESGEIVTTGLVGWALPRLIWA